ncbi:MAG: arylamine N-acetyltransferase [Bacteroidota bacterium]
MNLSNDLINCVKERLGVQGIQAHDLNALQSLYRAWCLNIPFDNVRKMISLRTGSGAPLPGMDAGEFFENWLENGSGATCWPMSNAFYELSQSFGFNARRVAGSMRDMGFINHGSVIVRIDDHDWLSDVPLLFNTLLPLDGTVFIGNDPVYPVEVEPDIDSHLIWMLTPPGPSYFYCRLLNDAVSEDFYLQNYEQSRDKGIFNQRLYARRNTPEKLIILFGNTRFSKTSEGVEVTPLTRDQVCDSLKKEIGISSKLIEEWVSTGALEASFEPMAGSPPPPLARKPPSQRA